MDLCAQTHISLFFSLAVSFLLSPTLFMAKIYVWLECFAVAAAVIVIIVAFHSSFFRSLCHKNLTKDLNPKVNKLWWKRTHKIFCTLKFFVQLGGGLNIFICAHGNIRCKLSSSISNSSNKRKKERVVRRKGQPIVYFIFIVFRSRKNFIYIGISPNGPIEFCMNHLVWLKKMNLNVLRWLCLANTIQ